MSTHRPPPGPRVRRFYRLLLRAFPREIRRTHGEEMEETFFSLLQREEEKWGRLGTVHAWLAAGWDALASGVRNRFREWRRHRSHKDTGVVAMLSTVWGDIRFAVRALGRRPLFSVAVVVTLALGIGANASVFTIVEGLLLTPLPYQEPDELVTLWSENPVLGWNRTNVNPADAWDWGTRSRSLEEVAVHYQDALNLTGDGPPVLLNAVRTTPNLLSLLGRQPVLGRDFLQGEVGAGRDDVVILTDGFWERRFGGDRDVLGTSLDLDGVPRTVVGILPPDFFFLDQRPDVFLPLDLVPAEADRGGHYMEALGRLTPGVGLEEARTELAQISTQLQEEYPEANENWGVEVLSTHDDVLGEDAMQASLILMAAVGFVLLMVCVNVGNLLLARGETRAREMAVRTALGAGWGRVTRQLLTESLVLGILGGALGLLLATWGYRGIVSAMPADRPLVFQFGLDWTVVGFTVAVTLAATLLFGIVPALRSGRAGATALRDGGRSGRSVGSARFGSALVILQTAMAVVLLVGGGLLMKSISGMRNRDLGFEPRNVLTLRLAPPSAEYPDNRALQAFWDGVEERVAGIPGVLAVGSTQSHPLMGSNWGRTVRVAGQDEDRTVRLTYLTPGTFDALGFRMVAGRPIRSTDDADAPRVAVVNETFVHRYLAEDADPLASYLESGSDTLPPVPIVGVIEDVVERGIDRPREPALYLSVAQGEARTRSLLVRTAGPPQDWVDPVQEAVWSLDPKLPLFGVETMEALVDRRVGGFAVIANLMGIFALLSLFLGALGIYGVTAFSAGRRTAEIGVRLAMGAERRDVIRMVVLEGARRAGIGLALGLVLAFVVAGALRGILVGVEPRDPQIFLGVTAVLAGVAFLGLWLPARRVAAVDPVEALTAE